LVILICALALSACGGESDGEAEKPPPETAGICLVAEGLDTCETDADFGTLGNGDSKTLTFEVTNTGSNDVTIVGVDVDQSVFSHNFGDEPKPLEAGASQLIEVTATCSEYIEGAETIKMAVDLGTDAPLVATLSVTCTGCSPTNKDCDNETSNGCETDTNTSLEHCGACNSPCDMAGASEACENGMCQLTDCDAGFGDCDSEPYNGCEESLSSLTHCGACAAPCSPQNATGDCSTGTCAVSECSTPFLDCDRDQANGCEADSKTSLAHCGGCNTVCALENASESCINGSCTLQTCETGFGNCDNVDANGCEKALNTNSHCGGCAIHCNLNNATASCESLSCEIVECDANYENCNDATEDGCEVHLLSDISNCGGCGTVCAFPNALNACVSSQCVMLGCEPSYVDVNGQPEDGCECNLQPGVDEPDALFVDSNCDGFDGDSSIAFFVSIEYGKNTYPGTMEEPFATIPHAANKAQNSATKKHVYVDQGDYFQLHELVSGVSIFGGFSAASNWKRSKEYVTTIAPLAYKTDTEEFLVWDVKATWARIAVQGNNITKHTVIGGLTISTPDSFNYRQTNHGLYCKNCPELVIDDCIITAGNGGPGINGKPGADGEDGGDGKNAQNIKCDHKGSGKGGAPGAACHSSDSIGKGGQSGYSKFGHDGLPGNDGWSGYGEKVAGGYGGQWSTLGGAGGHGKPSLYNGTKSAEVAGGGTGGKLMDNFLWRSLNGETGATGKCGATGGGGGGSGSVAENLECCGLGAKKGDVCANGYECNDDLVVDHWGSGGGGGGGGGWGGKGGPGAKGGGASFGVFLLDSVGAVISNSTLTAGDGGEGGQCGKGGNGGNGGKGGNGGTLNCGQKGGNGGDGTAGGEGRLGGGGAGGKSFAVYMDKTTFEGVTFTNNTYTYSNGGNGGGCIGGKSGLEGTKGSKGYFTPTP
jgi:hypothetical protein